MGVGAKLFVIDEIQQTAVDSVAFMAATLYFHVIMVSKWFWFYQILFFHARHMNSIKDAYQRLFY